MLNTEYNDQVLYVEGELQVHHLEKVKGELAHWAADADSLTLDLSQVVELDVAGLQIVLAFLRSRKGETKVTGISGDFYKALELTGLIPYFTPYMD